MENKKLSINIKAIIACLLWSTAFVTIKHGLSYMSPLSFAGIRFTLAGLILIPFCGNFFSFIKSVGKSIKLVLLVSLFQTIILYGIFNFAMTLVSGATGAILIGSSPFVTAIVAHLLVENESLNKVKIISIILGVIGIIILTLSKYSLGTKGLMEISGIVLLLVSSVSSALGNIIVSKRKTEIDAFRLTAAQIFIGGIFLFITSIPVEGIANFNLPLQFYLILMWLATVSAAAFSIWFSLLHIPEVKVSELNIWKFIIPLSGAILSWIFLENENPNALSILGMTFIVASIIVISKFQKKVK